MCITQLMKGFRTSAIPLHHIFERGKHKSYPSWNSGLGIRETRGNTTMKKALLATTAVLLSAGVAAADVKLSGYGRTGVIYYENDEFSNGKESQIISRLRLNIDASTSTDQGVDFGARFRLQWDQNSDTAGENNAGKLWVTANGLTVEVGNVETAIDSGNLIYATELGAFDRSVGFSDVTGDFFAYSSSPYSNAGRVGVFASYTLGDATIMASMIDPDQRIDHPAGVDREYSLAVDYTWNERLELAASYTMNGGGAEENDILFLGARYAVMDNARIGLNYVDTNDSDDIEYAGYGSTFALYGDYTLADGLTNIEGYIAHNNDDFNETDNAFGIGVNYDLGGARLGASLQRDYDERVTADLGVRFDF